LCVRKSKEKQQVVKALYSGNKMMMMRESLGIVTEGQGGVFASQCVKQLFDRARESLPSAVRHVYTAIDPTGGGPSKFAMVSGVRFNGKLQVRQCRSAARRTSSCRRIGSVRQTLPRRRRSCCCPCVWS
jgi:hypothetical protein